VAYAAGGANYHTWLPTGERGRLTDTDRYSRHLRSVITLPFLPFIKVTNNAGVNNIAAMLIELVNK